MTRRRIRDIRNDELIEAAIEAIHQKGFVTVTMAEIARTAGASAASINYYFGSKDQLMEKTMRRLMSLLRARLMAHLSGSETPRDRLLAIIDANFDDQLLTAQQCSVWVQFWANAPYAPRLARLHRINQRRVASHLRHELRQLVEPARQSALRASIQAYMDGVWIELAQRAGPVDAGHARQAAREVILTLLDGHGHSPRG
ncbi:transcriptional regulator BetI [Ruegeria sp. HKCCD8929]|uniref:choline-binding transcriptional repressor BetI n=1 Tax=Ruegeria sp. HKCCD8929 TaxID=2683006 RepID=UPI00148964FE|nr:transcriptional regulator BetI [Ruegeria sp. HKCCD8929]